MSIIVSEIGFSYIKSTGFTWVRNPAFPVVIGERGIKYDRQWLVVEGNMFVAQRRGSLPVPPMIKAPTEKILAPLGLGIEVRTMCQIHSDIEGSELVINAPNMKELRVPVDGNPDKEEFVQVWRDSKLEAVDQGKEAAKWFTSFLSRERKGNYRLMRMSDSCKRLSKTGDALVGFHDAFSFMMISQHSLDDLNYRLTRIVGERPVPMERFRPNIVIKDTSVNAHKPHIEDDLKNIKIGNVTFEGKTLCDRCIVTCTDQKSGDRSSEPLRTLAQYRRGSDVGIAGDKSNKIFFGRNFIHLNPVVIRVTDIVRVESFE